MHTYATNDVYDVDLQVTCPPCPTVLAEDSLIVFVVALKSLTVTRGATQNHMVGDKTWGTIKNSGVVVFKATLEPDPDGAADLIRWSGVTNVEPTDRTTAYLVTSESARQSVKAAVGTSSDTLDVWIMWATLELRATDKLWPTDPFNQRLPIGYLFPDLGPKTRFRDHLQVGLADGQIEMVGHLEPSGVNAVLAPSDSGWSFTQRATASVCDNGTVAESVRNIPDGPELTIPVVSSDDRIFYLDAPVLLAAPAVIDHTREYYAQLDAIATWNGEGHRASDQITWNYTAVANQDAALGSDPVVVNAIGLGREVFPARCVYLPFPFDVPFARYHRWK